MGESRDPGRPYVSHANKHDLRVTVKQFQDPEFEVRFATRRARQVFNIDRRLVPGGRRQFLEEKGLTQVLQEDGSLYELAHVRCPASCLWRLCESKLEVHIDNK